MASTKWKVYTNGTRLKRIVVNGKYTSQSMEVELTDAMEKMLQRAGIEYHDGKDLKGQIVEKGIEAEIIDIFRLTVQMRNSRSESEDREYDRLISPVLNDKGEFFDTATADKTLPQDADANGAYCIALKGLYEVKQIKENWKENEQFPRNKLVQDNKTWFDFMQKKGICRWKIFCPASTYFHKLYGGQDNLTYQTEAQMNGTNAHKVIRT